MFRTRGSHPAVKEDFTMRRLVAAAGVACLVSAALVWAAEEPKAEKKAADKKWSFLDLQPKANQKLSETFHGATAGANDLADLPRGEQTLAGVKFRIGEGCIQLTSTHQQLADKPEKVEGITVDKKFAKLHILHATGFKADDDDIVGEYTVNWDDGSSTTIPIVYGKDVLDWWYTDDTPEPTRGKVAWKGENELAKSLNSKIRLYLTTWENTKPQQTVKTIDFSSTRQKEAAPFCVAITLEAAGSQK
jgi:hypothetical protein